MRHPNNTNMRNTGHTNMHKRARAQIMLSTGKGERQRRAREKARWLARQQHRGD
jgi:hypothetical protein